MSEKVFLQEMGKRIKAQRKAKKITLAKLSEATGIDLSNLWFVENGERNVHILSLRRIAEALEVDLSELF